MAALTGADVVKHKEEARLVSLPILAGATIFNGALLMMTSAGFVAPATPTASSFFAGIATEDVDNVSGGNGDLNVLVFQSGTHEMAISGVAVTDVFSDVFAETDNTADVSIGQGPATQFAQKCGQIVNLAEGFAFVDINVGIAQQELGA